MKTYFLIAALLVLPLAYNLSATSVSAQTSTGTTTGTTTPMADEDTATTSDATIATSTREQNGTSTPSLSDGQNTSVENDINVPTQNTTTGRLTTYHYVTAEGITDTVVAPDPMTAIAIAPNIASNSGVAVDNGIIESGMIIQSVAMQQ